MWLVLNLCSTAAPQITHSSRFIDIDLLLKLSAQIPEQREQSLNQLKSTSPISKSRRKLSHRCECVLKL
uniref:Uncharacterized protein n=1 Tax=Xiphophorus maculatus TaxID=8083 RepID=A0A3B5QUB6_XIPMA